MSGSIFKCSSLHFVCLLYIFFPVEKYILLFLREGWRSQENDNWSVIDLLELNCREKKEDSNSSFPLFPCWQTKQKCLISWLFQLDSTYHQWDGRKWEQVRSHFIIFFFLFLPPPNSQIFKVSRWYSHWCNARTWNISIESIIFFHSVCSLSTSSPAKINH